MMHVKNKDANQSSSESIFIFTAPFVVLKCAAHVTKYLYGGVYDTVYTFLCMHVFGSIVMSWPRYVLAPAPAETLTYWCDEEEVFNKPQCMLCLNVCRGTTCALICYFNFLVTFVLMVSRFFYR